MDTRPPRTQAPNIHAGLPANDATIAGALKMPAPTTMPTMIATACHRVSTGRGWAVASPASANGVTGSIEALMSGLPWPWSAPQGLDEVGMHDRIEAPGTAAQRTKAPASRLRDRQRHAIDAEQAAGEPAHEGLMADQHDG